MAVHFPHASVPPDRCENSREASKTATWRQTSNQNTRMMDLFQLNWFLNKPHWKHKEKTEVALGTPANLKHLKNTFEEMSDRNYKQTDAKSLEKAIRLHCDHHCQILHSQSEYQKRCFLVLKSIFFLQSHNSLVLSNVEPETTQNINLPAGCSSFWISSQMQSCLRTQGIRWTNIF